MTKWSSRVRPVVAFLLTALPAALLMHQPLRYPVLSWPLAPVFRVLWANQLIPLFYFQTIDGPEQYPRDFLQPRQLHQLKSWVPDAQDTILVTFPKSGTHFLVQMTLQLVANASDEVANYESLHHHTTQLDVIAPPNNHDQVYCDDKRVLHLMNYRNHTLGHRPVHAMHMPFGHAPLPNVDIEGRGPKYIFVMRDPARTLISLHQMILKVLGRLAPTIDELWLNVFKGDGEPTWGGSWAEYNLEWWSHRDDPDRQMLFLYYEDAVLDPRATASLIAEFLDLDVSPTVIDKAVHRSSLPYMRDRAQAFEPPACTFDYMPLVAEGPHMVARASGDKSKSLISGELRRQIGAYCRERLAGSGLPIEKFPSCSW